MKQIIFILLTSTLISCKQNLKKDNLIGTWEIVSITNVKTGEVEFPKNDEIFIAEFKSDSLYLFIDSSSVEVYQWRFNGDSIFIDSDPVYIKELTKDKLVCEYDFFGKGSIELKKRNQ